MKTFLLSIIYCISASVCAAQAAFFDPTFGSGGKTIVPLGTTENGSFEAVVLQPDGKIIVAGIMAGQAVVVRFKENGTPDSSFAVNGFYISPASSTSFNDVVLQADGKIVAEGIIFIDFGNTQFLTVRLNANGTPDATFGSSGVVTTDFGPFTNDYGYALALQADGKIVIGGEKSVNTAIARLHANGLLDSSFGTNGLVAGP